jgi:hypothetical protein
MQWLQQKDHEYIKVIESFQEFGMDGYLQHNT